MLRLPTAHGYMRRSHTSACDRPRDAPQLRRPRSCGAARSYTRQLRGGARRGAFPRARRQSSPGARPSSLHSQLANTCARMSPGSSTATRVSERTRGAAGDPLRRSDLRGGFAPTSPRGSKTSMTWRTVLAEPRPFTSTPGDSTEAVVPYVVPTRAVLAGAGWCSDRVTPQTAPASVGGRHSVQPPEPKVVGSN